MSNPNEPVSHKAQRRVRHHTPDFTVCVIYRGESYAGVRGPGYFFVNPFTERVGETVSTKPRARQLYIKHLVTQDPIPVELFGKIAFSFDPREGDPVPISRLVRIPAEDLDKALCEGVQEAVFKAIRAAVNKYSFEVIQRGETLAALETLAIDTIKEKDALRPLGITNVNVTFTHAVLPEELQKRLNETAQRRYNAQMSQQLQQGELLRSLIVEMVEKVRREGKLEEFFNLTDAVNILRQVESPPVPPALPPENPTIIDSTSYAAEPEPPVEPPPSPKPKTAKPKSRSYLDPDF